MPDKTIVNQAKFDEVIRLREVALNRPQGRKLISNAEIVADVIINGPAIGYGSYIENIVFRECKFIGIVEIGESKVAGKVEFDNCTFENETIFHSPDNLIWANEKVFNHNLTIDAGSSSEFSVNNLNVAKTLTINAKNGAHLTLSSINVNQNIVDQRIVIGDSFTQIKVQNVWCKNLNVFRVAKRPFLNDFKEIVCGSFVIENSWDSATVFFKKSKIDKLSIIKFSNSENTLKITNKCTIEKLLISLAYLNQITVSDCDLDELILFDKSSPANTTTLENITIRSELRFQNINNAGEIFLRGITLKKDSKIAIISSNLGETDFVNCDFSKSVFEFENSKISEVFLSETDFPLTSQTKDKVNPTQSQLAFGQLATAYSKQGDTVKALEYQAREIEAHYTGLSWKSQDFFKKLSLWLNKWSNNFGRSWQRAFAFSVIVGVIFFYFLIVSTAEYKIGFGVAWNKQFLPSFLKFMNPLRFLETESLFKFNEYKPYVTLGKVSYLWDFIGRIFVAYGVYQMIQAFRRFGRK